MFSQKLPAMVFQLPWTSRTASKKEAHQNQPNTGAKEVKRKNYKHLTEETPVHKTMQKPTESTWLVEEMTARQKAQTFVAMTGFPMPFLP